MEKIKELAMIPICYVQPARISLRAMKELVRHWFQNTPLGDIKNTKIKIERMNLPLIFLCHANAPLRCY